MSFRRTGNTVLNCIVVMEILQMKFSTKFDKDQKEEKTLYFSKFQS